MHKVPAGLLLPDLQVVKAETTAPAGTTKVQLSTFNKNQVVLTEGRTTLPPRSLRFWLGQAAMSVGQQLHRPSFS